MDEYDEAQIKARLAKLNRSGKTAFAAACAERLFPLFERYARVTGQGDVAALSLALENVWRASRGEQVEDLAQAEEAADGMVPTDYEGTWVFEMGYGQNAAAAVAYAAGSWIRDSSEEATLGARQVYEAADYAAQELIPAFDNFNAPDVEDRLLECPVVHVVLNGLAIDLAAVESPVGDLWVGLRERARSAGEAWARTVP